MHLCVCVCVCVSTTVFILRHPHHVLIRLHGFYCYQVRAMQYAPNAYRKYLEKSDDAREREIAESEIAEMEEEGDF